MKRDAPKYYFHAAANWEREKPVMADENRALELMNDRPFESWEEIYSQVDCSERMLMDMRESIACIRQTEKTP